MTMPFFASLQRIEDVASASRPVSDRARDIVKIAGGDRDLLDRFIDGLDTPDWLDPFWRLGVFSDPPPPEKLLHGGLRSRVWPQSRYLVRMAPRVPELVGQVLETIDTTNWVVVKDIVDAALAMPPEHAVRLHEVIGAHVRRGNCGYLLDSVGKLVEKLANGGEETGALELFKASFQPLPESEVVGPGRIDNYAYTKGIREHALPSLVQRRPRELLAAMLQWMREALRSKGETGRHHPEEYSYSWRPAIEEHEQNVGGDFVSDFVSSLALALDLILKDGHLPLIEAIHLLRRHQSQLFERFELYALARHGGQSSTVATNRIMERTTFDRPELKHEYAQLVRNHWTSLDGEQQRKWLSWIDSGPSPSQGSGKPHAELDEEQLKYWKFQRLNWIREHLKGDLREFFEEMQSEHGKPALSDFVIESSVRWGRPAPALSVDQLKARGFEGAVKLVYAWKPGEGRAGFDSPSAGGVAGVFERYVRECVEEAASCATLLKNPPAIFVRSFLQGVRDSIKDGKTPDLSETLSLCKWVLRQDYDKNAGVDFDDHGLIDKDWRWSYSTIADLVLETCQAQGDDGGYRYGLDLKEDLFEVIQGLADGPSDSGIVQDKAVQNPPNADWTTIALNSARGGAMRSLFEYVEWVADQSGFGRAGYAKGLPGGFERLPEVKTFLEAQLDRPDDSFTLRAGFGWRVGLLWWIDKNWLSNQASRIFDLEQVERDPTTAYGWAAWNVFLFYSQPHVELYKILKGQYSYAVDCSQDLCDNNVGREQPFDRMAQHLLVLFGHGRLGEDPAEALEENSGLIQRLTTKSEVSVRTKAMAFVGRWLSSDSDEGVPEAIVNRFVQLWTIYWTEVGKGDARSGAGAYTFGQWFASGAFDPVWSIKQLAEFVEFCPNAEPDDQVLERLVEICDSDLESSVQIIDRMVRGDDEGWRIASWKNEARTVLEKAMEAGGQAQTLAEGVIDQFGRRGYLEFGGLLKR